VAQDDVRVRRVLRASQRVREAEERLEARRAEYYEALDEARAAGLSVSAIARALGVSRQRAQQLLRRQP